MYSKDQYVLTFIDGSTNVFLLINLKIKHEIWYTETIPINLTKDKNNNIKSNEVKPFIIRNYCFVLLFFFFLFCFLSGSKEKKV